MRQPFTLTKLFLNNAFQQRVAFTYSSAQISGLQILDNGFRLNNPLSLHVARLGTSGPSDVNLYLKNVDNDQEILILSASDPAAPQSINGNKAFSQSEWLLSEGQSINSTRVLNAKSLLANKFSYWPTGDYTILARAADGSVQEAIEFTANGNALEASFKDGLKVSLGSPNTIIKIPEYELIKEGGYAQNIRYSKTNYQLSAKSILKHHDQLPMDTMQPLPVPAQRTDGKILVQYQFKPSDPMFGFNGLYPVVEQSDGLTLLNPSDYPKKGRWGSAEQIKNGNGDTTAYPWYSAKTSDGPTFNSYFKSRSDEYDSELAYGTYNDLDPYLRAPDFVGVSGDEFGGFRFVATLAVDPRTIFRPKGGVEGSLAKQAEGQSWANDIAGPLPDVFKRNASTGEFEVDKKADQVPWHPSLDASGLKIWDEKNSWQTFPTFGSWYRNWWDNNTKKLNFPWTGLGYTYDPYYPTDADWGKNPPLGPATAEFVQLWRPEGNSDERWNFEILDVQTIPEAFGASTPVPNRSEPLKLVVKSLGRLQTDLFFYEADSVTGLIDVQGGVTPTDPEYLELAIEKSKKAGTFLLDNELPAYSEQQTFGEDLNLMSGKNYGIAIKVKSPEKEYFYSSYGDTSNQFLPLSDTQHNGFAIGFEDTKVGVGDDDYNDLILVFSNFSN